MTPGGGQVDMAPAYRYRAVALRVVDGDTLHLQIDLGFRAALAVPVRLRGVDCPELGTPEGIEARDYVRAQVDGPLVVESYRDRQSFARYVADVFVLDGREPASLAERLIVDGRGKASG